jgi:hypothetical protein
MRASVVRTLVETHGGDETIFSARNFMPTSAAVVVDTCGLLGESPGPQMPHGQMRVETGGGRGRRAARICAHAAASLACSKVRPQGWPIKRAMCQILEQNNAIPGDEQSDVRCCSQTLVAAGADFFRTSPRSSE